MIRTYAVGDPAFGRAVLTFFSVSVFALVERKNRNTAKMERTMLQQAKSAS
jgi:hypothetical protein